MGSGVGKTFDVRVNATGVGGGVISEILEFRGRPSMGQLKKKIELRMDEGAHQRAQPFRVQCLKVLDTHTGVWQELIETSTLHSGQTLRVLQHGERDDESDIPLKARSRLVFNILDVNNKGYIDAGDVRNVVRVGHIGVPTSIIYEWFQEADTTKTGRVSWREWAKFARSYPAVILQMHTKLSYCKNAAIEEAFRPHYMASTGASRHRAGEVKDLEWEANASPKVIPASPKPQSYVSPPRFRETLSEIKLRSQKERCNTAPEREVSTTSSLEERIAVLQRRVRVQSSNIVAGTARDSARGSARGEGGVFTSSIRRTVGGSPQSVFQPAAPQRAEVHGVRRRMFGGGSVYSGGGYTADQIENTLNVASRSPDRVGANHVVVPSLNFSKANLSYTPARQISPRRHYRMEQSV